MTTSNNHEARAEQIYQVGAVQGNTVILQVTLICARDSQHALVKTSALVSALEHDIDAGASDIRYCVSVIQDTQSNGNGY